MRKKDIVRLIKKKVGKTIAYPDIFSVVSILIDEMKDDVREQKVINISNFGKLKLKTYQPRYFFNVYTMTRELSNSFKILRFILAPNYSKYLKPESN